MAKYLLFIFFAIGSATISADDASKTRLNGSWKNTDSSTRGLTKIVISQTRKGALIIYAYGKCHPVDCQWGTLGVDNTDYTESILASYSTVFKNVELNMELLSRETLIVSISTTYNGYPEKVHESLYVLTRDST